MSLIKISNLIKSCNWNLSSDLFIRDDQHQQFARNFFLKKKEAQTNLRRKSEGYYNQKNQNNEEVVRERAKQSNRSCYKNKQLGQSVKHTTTPPPTPNWEREDTETWESAAPLPRKITFMIPVWKISLIISQIMHTIWSVTCAAFTSQKEDLACCLSSSSQEWTQRDAIIQLHLKSCYLWTPTSKKGISSRTQENMFHSVQLTPPSSLDFLVHLLQGEEKETCY